MPRSLTIPFVSRLSALQPSELFKSIKDVGKKIEINNVNWPDSFPDNRNTDVFLAHDGTNIYLLFICNGKHLKAEIFEDLGPVANDSCVEFFVSPDSQNPRYWNFEFNAIGTKNVSSRIVRPEPDRFTPDQLDKILTFPSVGSKPIPEKEGFQSWSLGVIIPLSLLKIDYSGKPVSMKGNFYKCGAKTSSPHYLSWAPIISERPDFHRPEFFASIILQ